LILYVDIMLAIDFSMDFLALFISSLLLHLRINKIRMVLSAALGALYGVVDVLLNKDTAATVFISIAVALIMVLIAFYFVSVRHLCFTTMIFIFVNAMLGGIMSLLYTFLNRVLGSIIKSYSFEGTYSFARIFIIIALTAISAMIFSRMLCSKKDVKTVEIGVKIFDDLYKLRGMCDSGNLLTEPLSGKKVILITEESKVGAEILKSNELLKKYIPYNDVNGSGIVKGVVPRELTINGKPINAIVATVKNESFNGCEALVPSGLV